MSVSVADYNCNLVAPTLQSLYTPRGLADRECLGH